jgi:glycerol kinase
MVQAVFSLSIQVLKLSTEKRSPDYPRIPAGKLSGVCLGGSVAVTGASSMVARQFGDHLNFSRSRIFSAAWKTTVASILCRLSSGLFAPYWRSDARES